MPFYQDLAFGNKYEQEYLKLTQPTEFKIMTGKFKEYDIEIIEKNCFDVELSDKFDVYLYDGGHKYEDHFNSIPHFQNNLNDS